MTEQYIVEEIQNVSVVPFVFRVGEGEGQYATQPEAESAARTKFHEIMVAVYSNSLPYHGAILLHQYGTNQPVIEGYEMVEREVTPNAN